MGMTAGRTGHFFESRARRLLRLGVGGLWIIDGLLQLQPGMFTKAVLIDTVWQPAAGGQPSWLAALMTWSISVASPHVAAFNWGIALTQLIIGVLLLTARRVPTRVGLWASAAFAVAVWVFGEGMGQVLTDGATILGGAPGSTLVYLVASILLLLPPGSWRPAGRRRASMPALASGLLLVLCGLFQFHATFWTRLGLSQPFGQAFMMPQPEPLRQAISAASGLVTLAPVAVNAMLVAVMIGGGLLLIEGEGEAHPSLVWGTLAFLAMVWVLGQDVGMLFSGMSTDPNTAPALALLLCGALAGRSAPAGSSPVREPPHLGGAPYAHR